MAIDSAPKCACVNEPKPNVGLAVAQALSVKRGAFDSGRGACLQHWDVDKKDVKDEWDAGTGRLLAQQVRLANQSPTPLFN